MASDRRLLFLGCCICQCHRGDLRGVDHAAGVLAVRLDASDPGVIAAASACPVCVDHHCAALSGRPAELRPLRPAPPPAPLAALPPVAFVFGQADGEEE